MTCISGVACIIGASVICIDVVVRQFPGMHDFKISESDAFLSASLSLSFGVMLFSSLYSMLPQSKSYLQDGGYSPSEASYLLIGLFLAGVVGIRVLSNVLHRFMPTHVVDCDHSHDEEADGNNEEEMAEHEHDDAHTVNLPKNGHGYGDFANEQTPLLKSDAKRDASRSRQVSINPTIETIRTSENGFITAPTSQRPSLRPRTLTRALTQYMAGKKENCDENGPCMGYSSACGQDCFRAVQRRGSVLSPHGSPFSRAPTWRKLSGGIRQIPPMPETDDLPPNSDEQSNGRIHHHRTESEGNIPRGSETRSRSATHHFHHPENEHFEPHVQQRRSSNGSQSVGPEHHHHVPTNAFMAIGLQTSIAIALHKAPEGFITYATNHANPTLGFAVFMALFIHNLTEGFAMSLPLYLALNSRFKAIVWSSVLGGVSQPLGAGIAALWFKLAAQSKLGAPSEGVYGGMFALTAGVMTSVALSLFSESLALSHNKGTCIAFAFLGMGILGFSFALTAK